MVHGEFEKMTIKGLPPKEREFLDKIAKRNRERTVKPRVYQESEMKLQVDSK